MRMYRYFSFEQRLKVVRYFEVKNLSWLVEFAPLAFEISVS